MAGLIDDWANRWWTDRFDRWLSRQMTWTSEGWADRLFDRQVTGLIDDWADRWLDFKVTGHEGSCADIRLSDSQPDLKNAGLIGGLAVRWLR